MKYSYPALPYFLDYRLSLPRLVHFLDLVLPQMHPHQQVREHNDIRQLTSHYLSLHGHDGSRCHPPLHMNFLFHSHAGLVHVLVEWYRHPLLVFSDYPKVEGVSLEALRSATTLEIYRQHVAFGIRAGQSTLFAFETQGNLYIMVGILIASNVPPTASKENRHWKHVAPHQTELAIYYREQWLKPSVDTPLRSTQITTTCMIGTGFFRPLKVVESNSQCITLSSWVIQEVQTTLEYSALCRTRPMNL